MNEWAPVLSPVCELLGDVWRITFHSGVSFWLFHDFYKWRTTGLKTKREIIKNIIVASEHFTYHGYLGNVTYTFFTFNFGRCGDAVVTDPDWRMQPVAQWLISCVWLWVKLIDFQLHTESAPHPWLYIITLLNHSWLVMLLYTEQVSEGLSSQTLIVWKSFPVENHFLTFPHLFHNFPHKMQVKAYSTACNPYCRPTGNMIIHNCLMLVSFLPSHPPKQPLILCGCCQQKTTSLSVMCVLKAHFTSLFRIPSLHLPLLLPSFSFFHLIPHSFQPHPHSAFFHIHHGKLIPSLGKQIDFCLPNLHHNPSSWTFGPRGFLSFFFFPRNLPSIFQRTATANRRCTLKSQKLTGGPEENMEHGESQLCISQGFSFMVHDLIRMSWSGVGGKDKISWLRTLACFKMNTSRTSNNPGLQKICGLSSLTAHVNPGAVHRRWEHIFYHDPDQSDTTDICTIDASSSSAGCNAIKGAITTQHGELEEMFWEINGCKMDESAHRPSIFNQSADTHIEYVILWCASFNAMWGTKWKL